jgi:ketosteroid isomerase-like protein
MRRAVLLSLTVVASAGAMSCARQQVDVTAAADAVRARSKACAAAEAAKDIERALGFWAEDAIVQTSGSPQIQGREAIRGVYRQYFGAVKEYSSTTSHVTVSRAADLAFEYGVNRTVVESSQGDVVDMSKYLLVWKKLNDNWYIAALSFTSDAPVPAPLGTKEKR